MSVVCSTKCNENETKQSFDPRRRCSPSVNLSHLPGIPATNKFIKPPDDSAGVLIDIDPGRKRSNYLAELDDRI